MEQSRLAWFPPHLRQLFPNHSLRFRDVLLPLCWCASLEPLLYLPLSLPGEEPLVYCLPLSCDLCLLSEDRISDASLDLLVLWKVSLFWNFVELTTISDGLVTSKLCKSKLDICGGKYFVSMIRFLAVVASDVAMNEEARAVVITSPSARTTL